MLNPLRHQLPAHSPISLGGILKAAARRPGAGANPLVKLEALLRERYPDRKAILVGSGTQALTLALRMACRGLDPRMSVALPAYSCFDVATASVALGRPVDFYDLDPMTLGPTPASLEAVLTRGARVVVLAPLFALPLDWSVLEPVLAAADGPLRAAAAESDPASGRAAGVRVVEDAAQGFGGEWEGRPLGAKGHLGVLSFGRGKGWTGGGAGGALLVPDEEWEEALTLLGPARDGSSREPDGMVARTKVLVRAAGMWGLARPGIYRVPRSLPLGLGETRYRDPELPRPLTQVEAALILSSHGPAEAAASHRRRVAREYLEGPVGQHSRTLGAPGVSPGGTGGFLRFPLCPPRGIDAFAHPQHARRLGAEVGYPKILPELEVLKSLSASPAGPVAYPGAVALRDRLVTLPTHSRTRTRERRKLVEMLGL